MYYLRDGLKSPALAWIYALVAGVAALTTTPFTQPNSIALAVNTVFGVPTWIVGVVVAVLTWVVIIGGIKSIGRAAEKLAPLKVGALSHRRPRRHRHVRRPRCRTCSRSSFSEALDRRGRRWASACSSRCATASRAASTRTRPATARRPSRTARAKTTNPAQQGLQAVMEVFIVSFVTVDDQRDDDSRERRRRDVDCREARGRRRSSRAPPPSPARSTWPCRPSAA